MQKKLALIALQEEMKLIKARDFLLASLAGTLAGGRRN
jgi:hypothetical protein